MHKKITVQSFEAAEETTPVAVRARVQRWPYSFPILTLYVLSTMFLMGIVFSYFRTVEATAPNPGHNFNEVGGGAVQGDILYASAADTLAALAKNTSATRYLANTGSSNNPAWAQVDLSNGITNTLGAGNGGTGASTLTANNVLIGNGTSAVTFVAPGASGNVLESNGTSWTSSAAPGKMLFSSRTASLTATTVCHPTAGTCGATDRTLGVQVPMAMTIRNLKAYMTTAPAAASSCAFTVKKATACSGAFANTALTCTIVGNGSLVTCADTSNSASIAADDCLQLAFTETGTCTGINTWVFEGDY